MDSLPRELARSRAERAARRLAEDSRVSLVYLFGAVAHGQGPGVRDVDLAVWTDPPLDAAALFALRADVVSAVGGAVDLVSLNDASVVLAHEIADTGECLFARNPELEVEFVTQARSRYGDFRPYLDEQWRLVGERSKEPSVDS